ncbi:MAG: outer membrane beta-barrel protein [Saprospiraceae bacterium]
MRKAAFKTALILFGIIFTLPSFSQDMFLPGFVITNSGDTLTGLIDYRNWDVNPKLIDFKTSESDQLQRFNPTQISSFYVHNELYVSGIVDVEKSPIRIDDLAEGPRPDLARDTIFLQALVQGTKSLLYYNTPYGNNNFYIKQNGSFDLLIYKKYIKKEGGKRLIAENNRYIGQLLYYLQDCAALRSKIQNAPYDPKKLVELFNQYYWCVGQKYSYRKEKEKKSLEWGLTLGGTITSLTFSGDGFPSLSGTDFSKSVNFTKGVFLNLPIARTQNKVSLQNELVFTKFEVSGIYTDFRNPDYYFIDTMHLGYSHMKLNTLFRYTVPAGKMHVFFQAGISNGLGVTISNYKKTFSKFYSTERTETSRAIMLTRLYEQGLVFGAGLKYKKLALEVRNERGNGMSAYTGLKSKTNRLSCLLSYWF